MAEQNPPKLNILPADVDGNRLTLLADGPERLDALVALIDGAERTLRLLYYMFDADHSGTRVRDALLAAVARGVKVSLLVDGFGTDADDALFFKPLIDGPSQFCRFQPRWGRRYLLRNHQKLALADEKSVMVGGFNVTDEYFGRLGENSWRDLGLQVDGPGVACLANYFDNLLRWAKNPHSRLRQLRSMIGEHSVDDGPFRWLFGGPTRRLSPWARSVKNDMLRATRLDMIAAYFSPSRTMLRRIYAIAQRGRARVVTASKSDNNTTIGAARHTYWRLLKRGAEIYEYQPSKLHTKLIVIDDVVHIGSANFDMRSLYLNMEMMLRIDDPAFAAQMRQFIDHEIADSKRITREEHRAHRGWFNRLKWSAAHFLVATMDYNVTRRLNFGLNGR
ncbi:MAG: phosphatidylserine/phosphatidylglycerophosphate/cardiolipin synthase family protein [Sphingosinicella sp.]|nr:phosphatidylserine/phosphatidylglycerophosphate/cardiolipin synthase family protein [Sphingosinicella sp.]